MGLGERDGMGSRMKESEQPLVRPVNGIIREPNLATFDMDRTKFALACVVMKGLFEEQLERIG